MSAEIFKREKGVRRKRSKIVEPFRAEEPVISVFMWGVNHTINELSYVEIPNVFLPQYFRGFSTVAVDNHDFPKQNMPVHFKVKEYCPLIFRNLRDKFGIDDLDYKESLIKSQPVLDESSSKTGLKIYQSHNKLFIIKTVTKEKVDQILSFLINYQPYIGYIHGKTLLPKYLGMYQLTVDGAEHYLVVIRNIFSNHPLIYKFNFKDSSVNLYVEAGFKITIGEEAKKKLMEMLSADVDFLTRYHMIDYSLLVGIQYCERVEQKNPERAEEKKDNKNDNDDEDDSESESGAISPGTATSKVCGVEYENAVSSTDDGSRKEINFKLKLIDVLTRYDGTSTTASREYGKRLIEFVDKIIQ